MNITELIEVKRQKALFEGNYSSYKNHLTRQCRTTRKRLGIATPRNTKFSSRGRLTAEQIGKNPEFVTLAILDAERAWASAWSVKFSRPETQEITGSARRYIVSRFHKAANYAMALFDALAKQHITGASDIDVLEAQAYASCLIGALELNKQAGQQFESSESKKGAWKKCLSTFSEAYIIYASLYKITGKNVFKDFLDTDVEQSVRYAAYQQGLPRTHLSSKIAREHFPIEQEFIMTLISRLDPSAFHEQTSTLSNDDGLKTDIPTTITWRSHSSPIVDAAIGQALATRSGAEANLRREFANYILAQDDSNFRATSYDAVLTACQEAVDATRRSIAELKKEGVTESDLRIQHLRVADLEVNYSLVMWRIGRNRTLISGHKLDDGATFQSELSRTPKRPRKDGKDWVPRSETQKHMLARLQQRIVLYDATIQSIDFIKSMGGAARFESFSEELEAKRRYFQSLRCLNIGFSYELIRQNQNALALYRRAERLISTGALTMEISAFTEPGDTRMLPTLAIYSTQLQILQHTTSSKVIQHQGLVGLQTLISSDTNSVMSKIIATRLHEYPVSGRVDLNNIIEFPPMLEPIPVKPIYLDLAWNYIEYPRQIHDSGSQIHRPANIEEQVNSETKVGDRGKKGWFGFGR